MFAGTDSFSSSADYSDSTDITVDDSTSSSTDDALQALDQVVGSAAVLIAATRSTSTPPPPSQTIPQNQSVGPVVKRTKVSISPVMLLVGLAVLVLLFRRG